jgi:N-acetylglucosaminyl-diphospho-decaprenol L-rhamnosyltransferase
MTDRAPTVAGQALTISVVSHGHGPLLVRLLKQLDGKSSLLGTRVVVTLNLPDETLDVSSYPSLEVIVVRNPVPRGFGANHNAAFNLCTTAWFGVLNPDLALGEQEPFTPTLTAALALPNVGVIAPSVVAANREPEDSVRANLTPWSLVRRVVLDERSPLDVHQPACLGAPFYWLAGMCLLINAKAFRKIDGFDERFFLYCEDYDLCARMYVAGYAIAVESEAQIIHEAQRDSHRSLRHMRWHLTSLLRVWLSAAFWRITLSSK